MAHGTTSTPAARTLSDADSLMWRIAADPVLRSPILVLGLLDRAPKARELARTLERAATLLPGLRSTIAPPPAGVGRARWLPDPDFSVDHHVRWVGAVSGGLRGVLDLAEPDATAAFDPARPPWSLTVVEGLAAGRAAVLLRFHHAVTDGMGGLQVAAGIFDRRRRPARRARGDGDGGGRARGGVRRDVDGSPAPGTAPADGTVPADGEGGPGSPGPGPADLARAVVATGPSLGRRAAGVARALASGAAAAARDPVGTAAAPVRMAQSTGRLLRAAPGGSPLLAGRSLDRRLHVFEVPLVELRAAAKATGGTVNDLLLGVVAGAFRGYHRHHGVDVATMSVTMPIDRRRPEDGPAGNHFVPARFALPVDDPDLANRVRIAGAIARSWRDEPALGATDVLAGGLDLLPGPIVTRVFGRLLRAIDADVVDLVGLVEPAFVGGSRIERLWAFAPPTGAAFSVTLLSHVGAGCLAVACDRAAVTDPELLEDHLEAGLDEALGRTRDGEVGR